MNRTEHLLWCLAEECCEVAHRASKAARFGINEIQSGQDKTNQQRLVGEIHDLLSVVGMLVQDGIIAEPNDRTAIDAKKDKVEKFLKYSMECGTLIE